MKIQKRVPNYKLGQLLSVPAPFENYNRSIIGQQTDSLFMVFHWETPILSYDLDTRQILKFDFGYYSQTTSTLQGKIIRSLFTREQIEDLLTRYRKENDTRSYRRLKGMAGIR